MSSSTRICLQPWNTINVGADGVAYPCCVADEKLVIGDLVTSSLEEIIAGRQMGAIRAHLLAGAIGDLPCVGCQNAPLGSPAEMQLAVQQHLAVTAATTHRSNRLPMSPEADDGVLHRVGPIQVREITVPTSGDILELYAGFSPEAFLEGRASIGEDFAIGCWVRRAPAAESSIVFHYAAASPTGWIGPAIEISIGPSGNLQAVTSPDGYAHVFVLGPAPIEEGRWTHVVVTKQGAAMHLFIDGVRALSAEAFPGRLHNASAIVRVGVNSGPDRASRFTGAIAALVIQPDALSSPAVEQLYREEALIFQGVAA